MTLQAYAQARGMEYWQLRGWAAQAPRWRAQLGAGDVDVVVQPLKFVAAAMPAQASTGGDHARIVCEVGGSAFWARKNDSKALRANSAQTGFPSRSPGAASVGMDISFQCRRSMRSTTIHYL